MVCCGSDTFGGVIEVRDGINSQPGLVLSGGTLGVENLGVAGSPLSRYAGFRQSMEAVSSVPHLLMVKVFFS